MDDLSTEALFDIGVWSWQDDELVWHEDNTEDSIDKDVGGD